jgi:arylsulfatase A-like enzyme
MYPPEAMPLPANFMPEHPFDNGEMTIRDELLEKWPRTPEAIRRHLAEYYGMISHLDEQVGRILAALERSGQAESTIVVFAGDNGLAIGSHGLLGKMSLYDHSVRVPLVMRGPGIPRSVRSAALGSLEDIFPTLCDLAGVAAPPDLDGLSLAPILRGARTAVRDHVFGAYQDVQRMIRSERWKLIQYPRIGKTQLFDLANDPHELRDLLAPWRARKTEWYTPEVDAVEIQRVAQDLERKLDGWRKAVGDSL